MSTTDNLMEGQPLSGPVIQMSPSSKKPMKAGEEVIKKELTDPLSHLGPSHWVSSFFFLEVICWDYLTQ